MRFGGALRSIVRPLVRTLTISRAATVGGASSTTSSLSLTISPSLKPESPFPFGSQRITIPNRHFSFFSDDPCRFDRLTDTRYPKRRPLDKPRRKRASLRPSGPYAWVKYVPGEPIQPSNPNQGSVKRRNEKKRIKLHRAFIKAEAKKRKVQLQDAKRKKMVKRVERKMAAVAREREWAQRLAELQQLEEEKKKSMA